MKKSFLLYLLLPFAFSCTSSYKSLQTPDDVYYSPAFLRTDSVRHDRNNDNDRAVNNSGPSIIYRKSPNYHVDYDDDYYYYSRRRKGYYDPYVYETSPRTTSKARTTNLKAYETHKSTDYINRKINQQTIPSVPPASNTSPSSNNSEKVRRFPKTGGSILGNAVRSIVNTSVFQPSSKGSNTSPSNSNSKSSSSSTKTEKTSLKAARHR